MAAFIAATAAAAIYGTTFRANAQTVESTDGRRWADMYELPAFASSKGQETVVRRLGYTVSFNPKLRIPTGWRGYSQRRGWTAE